MFIMYQLKWSNSSLKYCMIGYDKNYVFNDSFLWCVIKNSALKSLIMKTFSLFLFIFLKY